MTGSESSKKKARSGILSDRQSRIFKLLCTGNSASQIADILNKQLELEQKSKNRKKLDMGYIRKEKSVIKKKLEKEFRRLASSLRLDLDLTRISDTYVQTGLVVGFDWVHNTKVYLIFTVEEGIFVWFEHECSDRCRSSCKRTLDLILEERKIELPQHIRKASILEQFRYTVSEMKKRVEKK